MKKSLLTLAALTAFAGVASAQSSVTLFGLVDQSVMWAKNGNNTMKGVASNQLASNRLGFRGVEDLGGGLKAGFWLEAGMDNDVGGVGGSNGLGGSVMFNRRSTVSLMGGFGEIRLGRDYTPSFWNYTVFDPFGTNGPGSMLNVISTLGSGAITLMRANNTVGYFLPEMGGVYGQLQIAAGEGNTGNKYQGGRVGYAAGPVNVAVAYGRNPDSGGLAANYTDWNVGGSYAFGPAVIMAQYSKRKFDLAGGIDQKTWELGGTYAIGASTLKAAYVRSNGTTSALEARQIAVGYQYDLSKRTALYATYADLKNETGAKFNAAGGLPLAIAAGDKSRALAVGVRHTF